MLYRPSSWQLAIRSSLTMLTFILGLCDWVRLQEAGCGVAMPTHTKLNQLRTRGRGKVSTLRSRPPQLVTSQRTVNVGFDASMLPDPLTLQQL